MTSTAVQRLGRDLRRDDHRLTIDRLVHHAEILSLKGDSYRLRDKDIGARASAEPAESA